MRDPGNKVELSSADQVTLKSDSCYVGQEELYSNIQKIRMMGRNVCVQLQKSDV